jgi:hypothetical protein
LFWGLYQVFRKYRTNAIYLTLSVGALAYPATQILRFTQRGAEISSRIAPFLFVPLGFVLAVGVANLMTWLPSRLRISLPIAIVVIFMGGIVVSYPQWGRYPGPYLAAADTRSVEVKGIMAAVRIRQMLGEHNRIAGDRINGLLMISFGNQEQVAGYTDGVNAPGMFLSPAFGASELEVLCKGRIQYVVVDYRLTQQLPMIGYYYEDKENNEAPHLTPMEEQALQKFERASFADRIFDSGDVVIYDVRRLDCSSKQ